jgi:hypothetical protein
MSRSKLAARPPVDPRARRIVRAVINGNHYGLTLECGHEISRKFLCPPSHVICHRCPPRGGLGGACGFKAVKAPE